MNINRTSESLLPRNVMSINTIRSSMLGKRKGGKTGYERAKKRTNLSMIAEVGRITNEKINIRLPINVVNDLERINNLSSIERYEYAGKINFEGNNSQVKFNAPTRLTSRNRGKISSEIVNLIKNYYITYHTHPAASSKINNNNNNNQMNINNNSRSRYFTLPSGLDFEAYIKGYPGMQANIISDAHGYYVIDIIEAADIKARPNPKIINRAMEWIRSQPFLRSRNRSVDGYEYFESTIKEWKSTINNELNPYMIHHFGVSVRYYGYNDTNTALISLRRRTLSN